MGFFSSSGFSLGYKKKKQASMARAAAVLSVQTNQRAGDEGCALGGKHAVTYGEPHPPGAPACPQPTPGGRDKF